jgi:CPA1 family monovalent cation:H+ antiporter
LEERPPVSRLEFVALVLALVGPLLAVARPLHLPPSLLLFGAGLASTLLPGLPVRAEPELLISLFLPPILYAATVRVTWHLLRFTLLPGVTAGAALSAVTILAVALVAHMLLPSLGWPASLLVGIVAALFDTRLLEEATGHPRVPRVLADALKAREMTARVVALSALTLVLTALEEGRPPSLGEAAWQLTWPLLGGAAAGLLIGRLAVWLRSWAVPPPVDIALSIATPYLGSLAAGFLDLSMVVTVMAAALAVSAARVDRDTGAPASTPEVRLSSIAFWDAASLLVSSLLYLLAGRALPEALGALDEWPVWRTAGAAAAILALVLVLQFLAGLASTAAPRIAEALNRGRHGAAGPPRRTAAAAVMTWASTRSVIGLVVALSVPAELPGGRSFATERDLVLVVATLVVLGSVLLQGLTLRATVQAAGLGSEAEEREEQELAMRTAAAAAEHGEGAEGLDAARRASLRLREQDQIGDEALRETLRETDLRARADEGPSAALPGAGPPNS